MKVNITLTHYLKGGYIMSMKNVILCLLLGLCLFFASPGLTIAGEYPDKPITMILGSRPGGSHDLNARVFTSVIPQY